MMYFYKQAPGWNIWSLQNLETASTFTRSFTTPVHFVAKDLVSIGPLKASKTTTWSVEGCGRNCNGGYVCWGRGFVLENNGKVRWWGRRELWWKMAEMWVWEIRCKLELLAVTIIRRNGTKTLCAPTSCLVPFPFKLPLVASKRGLLTAEVVDESNWSTCWDYSLKPNYINLNCTRSRGTE